MKFVITFDTGNAAFGETLDDAPHEIARILREIAGKVEQATAHPGERYQVRDVNENRIGFYGLMEEGGA